ncbi:MAG: class I SAM-dependent methyltransferase [archaeon]|nr:class I SAM-dependent methyltransferase [archaeon]
MGLDRSLKNTFGKVSELYDSSRPSYPTVLINDVLALSKIKKGDEILDVGCGSGKATVLFGGRGYDITGLDISENLLRIAEKKTYDFPEVKYVVGSFEENSFPDKSFDLIISAQAWHWVDPDKSYNVADRLLKKGGSLALFWNFEIYEISEFLQELEQLFIGNCLKYIPQQDTKSIEDRIERSGLFEIYQKVDYIWNEKFTSERYLNLVKSLSWVNSLTADKIDDLLNEVELLLQSRKEPINIPYESSLLMVKRKED